MADQVLPVVNRKIQAFKGRLRDSLLLGRRERQRPSPCSPILFPSSRNRGRRVKVKLTFWTDRHILCSKALQQIFATLHRCRRPVASLEGHELAGPPTWQAGRELAWPGAWWQVLISSPLLKICRLSLGATSWLPHYQVTHTH
jgi:hypothetical protein